MTFQVWKRPLAGGLVIAAGLLALPYGKAQEAVEIGADVLIDGPPTIETRPLDVLKLKTDAIAIATDVVGLGANHLPGKNCAEALKYGST